MEAFFDSFTTATAEHPKVELIWNFWPFNWIVPLPVSVPLNVLMAPLYILAFPFIATWNFLPDSLLWAFNAIIVVVFGLGIGVLLMLMSTLVLLSPYIMFIIAFLLIYNAIAQFFVERGLADPDSLIFDWDGNTCDWWEL